jgi:hypothetical protein
LIGVLEFGWEVGSEVGERLGGVCVRDWAGGWMRVRETSGESPHMRMCERLSERFGEILGQMLARRGWMIFFIKGLMSYVRA